MDDATNVFLTLFHDITPLASMKIYHEVDFLES